LASSIELTLSSEQGDFLWHNATEKVAKNLHIFFSYSLFKEISGDDKEISPEIWLKEVVSCCQESYSKESVCPLMRMFLFR